MHRFLLLLMFVSPAFAQKAPFDIFPAADPPYFRVRYEASSEPAGLVFPVNYTAWIPPGVSQLRGVIVHQHGCGEGSCKSGLTGAFDLHWQALAKKHDCALLAPSYEQPEKENCQMWCDPRNGSDATFQRALADLGAKSGHPELAKAPWALWGHSGGGHWAGGMALLHPERTAAAWLRSGVPLVKADASRTTIKPYLVQDTLKGVPLMCNPGTKEGLSVKDGRFRRLPQKSGGPLRPMPAAEAWLAPLLSAEAVPAAQFAGPAEAAVWLPNEVAAKAWMQYVKDSAVGDTTPPPAPYNLRVEGAQLFWEAEADLESGIAHFIIERDGHQIGTVPEQAKNPFGRPVFQGLQYSDTPTQPLVQMAFTDSKQEPGKKHAYRVFAVNTAGLRSYEGAVQNAGGASARR